MPYEEVQKANSGQLKADFYKEALKDSQKSRDEYDNRKGVVKAEEMPWEDSPQGKLKHVINEKLNTREYAVGYIYAVYTAWQQIRKAPTYVRGGLLCSLRQGIRPARGHEL
jgi:hypothetical protein